MANAINWFEIPAAKFDRAVDFYEKVLNAPLQKNKMMHLEMGFLPVEGDGVGGAVVAGEGYSPSAEGALIYLNGGDDLSEPLSRVESAGGKIVMPKSKISDEVGFMAVFLDCEGNRVAFHSQN